MIDVESLNKSVEVLIENLESLKLSQEAGIVLNPRYSNVISNNIEQVINTAHTASNAKVIDDKILSILKGLVAIDK